FGDSLIPHTIMGSDLMNSQPAQLVPPPLESDLAVIVASDAHCIHAEAICNQIHESAFARGTGIARRSISYIQNKMRTGHAIIALTHENEVAGFCYIETWGHDQFVANSGLIVFPQFRNHGLASAIKSAAFELSRAKYPNAKLFGMTT